MLKLKSNIKTFVNTYFIIFAVVFLVISIIIYPRESVAAAYDGLTIWFSIVLPALLPFFIGSELMVGLGVVKFIGIFLEPIMRPIFNVPGEGSFAFVMSITSGYPVGVKIVSKLRSQRLITAVEAQRLISFSSTSGPLFLMGAVGVGMFRSTKIGVFLAVCHYLSVILVGLLFSYYKPTYQPVLPKKNKTLSDGIKELKKIRNQGPPLGILIGDAVRESLNTMLMIGGFIVLFSVIIRILQLLKIIEVLALLIHLIIKPLFVNLSISKAFITGIFEITIGSKFISEIHQAALITKLAATSFLVAWSGFSIHMQAISIISTTDIKPSLYLFSKLIHGILSAFMVFLLYPLFTRYFQISILVYQTYHQMTPLPRIVNYFKFSAQLFIVIVILLLVLCLITAFFLSFKNKTKR